MNEEVVEYPEYKIPFSTMKRLFDVGGFFHGSNKSLLSRESSYFITKSQDGKYLLLIQEVENVEEVLASVSWEDKSYDKTTNPWKDFTDKRLCRDDSQDDISCEITENIENVETLPAIKKKFHMHENWPVEKPETIVD